MTQLLMDEPSSSLLTLGDEEETALVEVMCCAIQRAVGACNPPGRGKTRVGNLYFYVFPISNCKTSILLNKSQEIRESV